MLLKAGVAIGVLAVLLAAFVIVARGRVPAPGAPGAPGQVAAPSCVRGVARPAFDLPSYKGINYGTPDTTSGRWVGTEWLRQWDQTQPELQADLDFIQREHLGSVIRIFLGLDQAMRESPAGFQGFDAQSLRAFQSALQMVGAHGMKAIVVVYDQEDTGSAGNFHFEALDGQHPQMRAGYLRATREFFARFGADPAVAGWDLFNEAYGSLGRDDYLPRPSASAQGPVSPGYDDATVHAWLRDLYTAARCAAPRAWLTVSDFGSMFDTPDNAQRYAGVVDFYDVHMYSDAPQLPDFGFLHAPVILGEVGADLRHYQDQRYAAPALQATLGEAAAHHVSAVLAHDGGGVIFPTDRSGLTPAGRVLAGYSG